MKAIALLAAFLGGCAAARPPRTSEPRGEWRMAHRETDGHAAGAARLAPGGWIVFELRAAPLPSVLEVREDRRLAAVGEEIRVRVRVDPRADPGVYVVRAASDARFAGPAELALEPGLEGTFRLYSERPGAARVEVELMEVIRHVDAAAAARRPR
jgi:hypothetical protein